MSLIDSIKKIFVSHSKEEDIKEKEFENPLDRMPLANGTNRYAHPERMAELEAETNPRPEEEIADWFNDKGIENPDESDEIEEEKTMHQKMYEMAIEKHNPWSGGSEGFQGGSEQLLPPRPEEEVYDNFNGT